MKEYPLIPNKISTAGVGYSTIRVKFEESSYEQRIATRSRPKYTFKLEHHYLSAQEEKALADFFDECKGAMGQFRFYNYIDEKYYICNFKNDELSFNRVNKMLSHSSVEIETC